MTAEIVRSPNTRRISLVALLMAGTCLSPLGAGAQNATWSATPVNGQFFNAQNWFPTGVPTGIASFGASSITNLTFSSVAPTSVAMLAFNAGGPGYVFTVPGQLDVGTISSFSANAPSFLINSNMTLGSAGNANLSVGSGGGSLTVTSWGSVANFTVGGSLTFSSQASLGNANITVLGGGLVTLNTAFGSFATITTQSGGTVLINGGSLEGAAQLITQAGGTVDMRGAAAVSVGSIEGAGNYLLGPTTTLTTGSNGLSTTVSGVISGAGASLVKVGSGTLTLTGANTYTGGTTVLGGVLQGNSTSLQGPITNNATVVFDQPFTGTYGGNISGYGTVIKQNVGTLILTGTNTYTGGTAVTGGVLQGNTNSLQGAIMNNATVVFDQATNGTYSGVMSGTGTLFKQNSGVLTLTGANTFTGGTAVAGGGLVVNGSLASGVVVGQGAALGGTGSITGAVVNQGTLSPGSTGIGTLTVNGSYAQNGGTYQVEVSGSGQSDLLRVAGTTGTATLNGGQITLTGLPGGFNRQTTYTIVNTTGGLSGSFSGVSENFAFLSARLSYDANNAYLTLFQGPNEFQNGGQTFDERAVGNALDRSAASASGDFATVLQALDALTTGQGPAALEALSGQPYTDFGTMNVGAGFMFLNTLGNQMMGIRTGSSASAQRVALAEACGEACDGAADPRLGAWVSGMASLGSVEGNGNSSTFTYNLAGAAAGIDYRLDPRFLVGFAVGYSGGRSWVDSFLGTGTTDNYSAALYASFTQAGFYLDAASGYTYSDNQLTRPIVIPGLATRNAAGRTGANQFIGQAEAGYRIGIYEPAQGALTPFARFQIAAVSQNAFGESGAGSIDLNVAQQNTTSTRTVLGADLSGKIPLGTERTIDTMLRLGWSHDYADTARPVTASFAGAPGAAFTVYGAQPQRDAAVIGFGANTKIAAATSIYARYDGEIASRDSTHAFTAGFRMTW